MPSFIDLTGERFDRLLVLERGQDYIQPNGNKQTVWICQCDCGNIKSILAGHIRSGATTSCGCYAKERTIKREVLDLTRKRFGRLIVIKRVADYVSPRGTHYIKWLCKCDCGMLVEINGSSLRYGKSLSCGCYKSERTSSARLIDITGNKYGKLTVIEIHHKTNKHVYWRCVCDCGNETIVTSGNLNNTTSCGCLRESYIASELKKYFIENYNAEKEYKICINPKTNCYLPFDIYIPAGDNPEINGYYIEVNGEHHYKLSSWHKLSAKRNETSPEEEFQYTRKLDRIKRKFACSNGVYIEIDIRKLNDVSKAIEYIEGKIKEQLD